MDDSHAADSTLSAWRQRRMRWLAIAALLVATAVALTPTARGHLQDAVVVGWHRISDSASSDDEGALATTTPDAATDGDLALPSQSRWADLRAAGKARELLAVARAQMGVTYVYGASPRHAWAMGQIGRKRLDSGFDCSSFASYVFQEALGVWVSGSVAHTDEIWTQGGALPLDDSPGETDLIIRGNWPDEPPGGFQPGDMLLPHPGAGGYYGHVAIVSEYGLAIEAYPPDVHETKSIDEFIESDEHLGWVRVKALSKT